MIRHVTFGYLISMMSSCHYSWDEVTVNANIVKITLKKRLTP